MTTRINKKFTFASVDFDPFSGKEIEKVVPSINSQKELWLACKTGGEDANRSYNLSLSLNFFGRLNRSALKAAIDQLLVRHESLRSTFSGNGDFISIDKNLEKNLSFEDLALLPEHQQDKVLEEFYRDNARTRFNFVDGPLVKFTLFKKTADSHILNLTVHHIVCDRWSLGVILEEFSACYSAIVKGQKPKLPNGPAFSQYALDTSRFEKSQEYSAIEKYWLDQYKDFTAELILSADFPRPTKKTYNSSRHDLFLDPKLVNQINELGHQSGCSFVQITMTALEVLLYKITGKQDLVVGLPVAGQATAGLTSLVSHSTNLLPLRSHVDGELSFIAYVQSRKSEILDDLEHQHFTFSDILPRLSLRHNASTTPLIQLVLNNDMGMGDQISFHGLTHKVSIDPKPFETHEIFINLTGSNELVSFQCSYNTDLFLPETIKGMMSSFRQVLEQITMDPEIKIKDVAVVMEGKSGGEIKKIEVPSIEPQTEIFVACILGKDDANRSYNMSFSEYLTGNVDYQALRKALEYLVKRHESLRATFSEDGLKMYIHETIPLPYTFIDISKSEPEEREAYLEKFKVENVEMLFDLINGPLLHFSLIKLDENKHFFTINIHHIICDGWSINGLYKEFGTIYSAFAKGVPPELPTPALFSKYALEKQDFYERQAYHEIGKYWKNKFEDKTHILDLPTDFKRPPIRRLDSRRLDFTVSFAEFPHLATIGRKLGSNPALIYRVVMEALLYRMTRQTDIVTAMPVAGQLESLEYGNLIGHCVNMLPIRTTIDGQMPFTQYLNKRKQEIFDDFENQLYTFGSILKNLPIQRDSSRIPLVPFVLNYEKSEENDINFHGITAQAVVNPRSFENFEIILDITDDDKELIFRWAYHTALFAPTTIMEMHQNLLKILEGVVNDPNTPIDKLALQGDDEAESTVPERRERPLPLTQSFLQKLEEIVDTFPNRTALTNDNTTLTFRELSDRSNQFCHLLHNRNIQPNDQIGLHLDRSENLLVVLLGILKAGATYVPIDINYPEDRIQGILDNTDLRLIIAAQGKKLNFPPEKIVFEDEIPSLIKNQRTDDLDPPSLEDHHLIYILHTSGSTGKPKGVCMGHRALSNLIQWQAVHSVAHEESKTLQFSPITFDVSFQEIFSTWCTGGTLVMVSDELRLDSPRLLEFIEGQQINRIFLPFVALQALAEAASNVDVYPSSLKEVMTAGEQLIITPQLVRLFSQLNESVLFNQYGPTETHVVTELRLSGNPTSWPNLPGIGRPIHNTQVLILDDNLNQVPRGVTGELCIAGMPLAEGYLRAPELTAEKFLEWNTKNEEKVRVYRTGDMARILHDDQVEFLGRSDNQIKIRGFRVELGEIEAHLNGLDEVQQAVVGVQEDTIGQKQLIAYLLMADNPTITIKGKTPTTDRKKNLQPDTPFTLPTDRQQFYKKYLAKMLPAYMVPQEFVEIEDFPMTQSGKIDRKKLPRVKISELSSTETYYPPSSPTESLIAKIWMKLLRLSKVSIRSNFFELGGYSLIGIRMMAAIERETGTRLPLVSLFENPTIEELSAVITSTRDKIKWDSLVPIKSSGNKPPLYIVHGGGLNVSPFYNLLGKLDPEQPIYGIQAKGLNGVDDPPTSIEQIAAHYVSEILEHNPYGPYAISGYSFGGLIAYEIALQLKGLGKQVNKLILFDTYADQKIEYANTWDKITQDIRNEFGKRIIETKLLFEHPRIFKRIKEESLKRKLKRFLIFLGLRKEIKSTGILATQERIIRINRNAVKQYKIQPYPDEIHLFRVNIRSYYEPDLTYMGWVPHVEKVNIIEVEGEHFSMFDGPKVVDLANKLQQILDMPSGKMEVERPKPGELRRDNG